MTVKIISLFIFFSILGAIKINGQSLFTIRVVNNLTGKPINDAEIIYGDSAFSRTNVLGYFQLSANPSDTVLITHPIYEDLYLPLPNIYKFQTSLQLKNRFLVYSDGLSMFYKELQKRIRYPEMGLENRQQANIFFEFQIDSLGNEKISMDHTKQNRIFIAEIKRAVKKIAGNWSKDYVGKVFVLPVFFRISSSPIIAVDDRLVPKYDMLLNEIIVNAYR